MDDETLEEIRDYYRGKSLDPNLSQLDRHAHSLAYFDALLIINNRLIEKIKAQAQAQAQT